MSDELPALHTEFRFPDTELAVQAYRFAERAEPAVAFNHSVRSYVYATALAPTAEYDDELLFLSCVLHDIGLTEQGDGDQRFEVDGADVAAAFLREHGVAEQRVAIVWDAIALHTSDGIAHRKSPVAGLTQAGVAADILGRDREKLPAGLADRVHTVLPRADVGYVLADLIVAQAKGRPGKASPLNFPGHLLSHHPSAATMPNWYDLIAAAGWGDRPNRCRRS